MRSADASTSFRRSTARRSRTRTAAHLRARVHGLVPDATVHRTAVSSAAPGPIDELPADLLTLDPDILDPGILDPGILGPGIRERAILDPGQAVAPVDFTGLDDLSRERVERTERSGLDVVVKRAEGTRRTALQREATVLEALEGAGVVEFVASHRRARHDELWTVDAGRADLADPWSAPPSVRAAAFSRGCAALGRLHARGWFHGAVTLDHLVVDRNGVARWCSLGSAGRIDEEHDGERLDRIAITRAAHRLARALPNARTLRRRVERLGDEADPRRLARLFRQWSRHHESRPLARVADAAAAVGRRVTIPTERRELRLRRRSEPRSQDDGAAARRSSTGPLVSGRLVSALLASGLLVTGLLLASAALRPASSDRPSGTTSASTPAGIDRSDPGVAPAAPVTSAAPRVDVGGRPTTLGRPGDQVLVTDTDCDGVEDTLLLRPSTGEVFHFDLTGTPPPVTGRLVHRDPDATQLLPSLPCGTPLARRGDGSSAPIVTPLTD